MYHADRDKGKCDLHGGRRQGFVECEGQNQPEIELKRRANRIYSMSPRNQWPGEFPIVSYCESSQLIMNNAFVSREGTIAFSRRCAEESCQVLCS